MSKQSPNHCLVKTTAENASTGSNSSPEFPTDPCGEELSPICPLSKLVTFITCPRHTFRNRREPSPLMWTAYAWDLIHVQSAVHTATERLLRLYTFIRSPSWTTAVYIQNLRQPSIIIYGRKSQRSNVVVGDVRNCWIVLRAEERRCGRGIGNQTAYLVKIICCHVPSDNPCRRIRASQEWQGLVLCGNAWMDRIVAPGMRKR